MEITLPLHRPPPDRRLIAAAVIATPIAGACLGAMFFTFPTRVDEVLSLALFMGMTLFGLFALFAFAYSRAAAPWFVLLMFGGCGSAALPSGALNQACDFGSANACYTAGPSRHADGIAIDRRACEEGAAESCERLLVRDPQSAITHCETWKKTCRGEACGMAENRCEPWVEREAAKHRSRLEELREMAALGSPSSMNSLAWMLATSKDDSVRDGRAALFWAEKAVAEAPNEPAYIDTLAAAYAERGRWDDAIATQKKAIAALRFGATRDEYERHLAQFERHEALRE